MPYPSWFDGINDIQNRMGPGDPLEGGVDLGTNKIGVPFEALGDGTIVGAGYFCHSPFQGFMTSPTSSCSNPGYGVVTIRMNVPGYGMQDLYYQHINIDPSITLCSGNCPGQQVQKGQVIGTGGVGSPPQNLLEMGVNVPWGGVWGSNHPGPWVDPEKIIRALMANYGPNTTSFTGTGKGGTTNPVGFSISPSNFLPQALLDWIGNPIRMIKMLAGIILIFIALAMLMAPSYEQAFKKAFSAAQKVAETA